MAGRVNRSGLQVAEVLDTFINDEALPGSGVARDDFWSGVASLVSDLTQRNQTLLDRRDELQAQIDRWHLDRKGQPIDTGVYKAFLVEIGYLVDEGPDFEIATAGVDPNCYDSWTPIGCPGTQCAVCTERSERALGQPL